MIRARRILALPALAVLLLGCPSPSGPGTETPDGPSEGAEVPSSAVIEAGMAEGADEAGRHDDLERRESGGDAVRASTVASELAEADALLQAAHAPDDVRRGLRGKIHGARRRATTAARVLAGGTE